MDESVFCVSYVAFTRNRIQLATLSFLYFTNSPSANKTATASMDQICVNTMGLHKYDPCKLIEKSRARNEQRQQYLAQSVKKLLVLTTAASSVGSIICRSVTPTTCILQKKTSETSPFAHDSNSDTIRINKNYIFPVNCLPNPNTGRRLLAKQSPALSRFWPHRREPSSTVPTKP